MPDNVQPVKGEEQEVSSSGLLLSVDPLPGTTGYKLSADDTDAGRDTTDVAGGDSDTADTSDSDGTDTLGDSDATDKSDSDADGTDVSDADGTDTGPDADGTDPLGIAPDNADTGDRRDTDTTDAK
jgi:hypothetical protein